MTLDDNLTYDGISQAIREWALDYGIPGELIIDRLNQGQSVESAITTMMPFTGPRCERRARTYSHDGLTLNVNDWSERSGIPTATLRQRLARGMPIGEALNSELNAKNVPLTHAGETKTLSEWAKDAGINYSTLRHRVMVSGMSVGEAIAMQKHAKPPSARRSAVRQRKPAVKERVAAMVITIGGVRIEIAWSLRGVALNFLSSSGTGGGSTAQESAQIDFSQEAP